METNEEILIEEKPKFVHLHVHTEYSLLDGASRIQQGKKSPLLNACKEKNMPAIAITDHGNMYGVYAFCDVFKNSGVKPIVGCEFYVCDDMRDKKTRSKFNHLVLLAKDDEGYKNLVKLDSLAFVDGFYYKPRIDIEFLKEHCKGLVCLSACLAGTIPQFLLAGEYEKAREHALMLKDMFDDGDFYIELQDHGIPEQKQILPLLIKLAREINVKVVATNDVHYIDKTDAEMHDVLLCIQTGKTIDDPNRMRFENDQFYLKDYDEMAELFSWCPEALETTLEIAEKCNVELKKNKLMPPYKPEDGSAPDVYLRKLAYEGLEKRYEMPLSDEITQRAEYELNVIISMGFAEYYLIVWDFIHYAKLNDIPVGAGRGSGVGSIVAYAMGITNVDPLKYNLLFERFLNPERVSMPDFDIDFCVEGREKVKEYVVDKYGADKVCEIITFGTMATKAAFKDVARVFNVPFDTVNKITKLMPAMGKFTLQDVLGQTDKQEFFSPEVAQFYESDDAIKKIVDLAIKVEGMPRQTGKHAAGVVICKEVISDYVPLQRNGNDITTQFQKDAVEKLGLLKMDFLGLRTLTDIKKTKQYILEDKGVEIDFDKIGYEDEEAYKLIASGDTDAVFQLESPGMKKFMKDLRPVSLEEIIAGISLYRPGPMESIPKFIESKNSPDKITYSHPMLEPILNMTYGCMVYQEQVMQIVRDLAGFTLGGADILRRAMGKKNEDIMKAEKIAFLHGRPANADSPAVEGAVARGVPEDVADKIFEEIIGFAKYAFNKSHAAAYAVVAYETAYLKRYYPIHFITAVLNNRITTAEEIATYVGYLKDCNYKVFPPDINKSGVFFGVEGEGVRFGLTGIKNVGEAVISAVVEERKKNGEFKSLYDFIKRTAEIGLNKRLIESLIYGGAFDCFGETRATNITSYEGMLAIIVSDKKQASTGQISLFDIFETPETSNDARLIKVEEYQNKELLLREKEVLNVYLSGHPLDDYREVVKNMDFNLKMIKDILHIPDDSEENGDFETLIREFDGREVVLGAMLGEMRKRVTKSGQTMVMGRVEDLYDSIEIVLFPRTYESSKHLLQKDNIVLLQGTLQTMGRPQITVKSLREWDGTAEGGERKKPEKVSDDKIYVKLTGEEQWDALAEILVKFSGETQVLCQINKTLMDTNMKVRLNNALLFELYNFIGEENVKVLSKK